MRKYDHIVVGSGASGLTMTLLLAMNGQSVLLLEKAPRIGGSLSRFSRKGIAFDTGFHFTGGLHEDGILSAILSLLGIRNLIEPIFISEPGTNRFFFEREGRLFDHPSGIENIKKQFKGYFPGESAAIDRYFEKVLSVCSRTPSLNIHENTIAPPNLDEDYITLDAYLRGLTSNELLRGLLSGYAMCYGVRPDEISLANHCRMVLSFYESLACVRNGGDAFVSAFQQRFKEFDVTIRCGAFITELTDIQNSKVGRFILNTGEEITASDCVFTIHPGDILRLLPEKHYSKAFSARISAFESSAGFFSLFATVKEGHFDPYPDAAIISFFPETDVNMLLDPGYTGVPALVVIKSPQPENGSGKAICILQPSFPGHVSGWTGSRRGTRPPEYLEYKQRRVEESKKHIFSVLPDYRDSLDILDAGSVLTLRDFLNNPDGSAYGVKQKIGQFNVIGKLPLHNLFAAGQSALLPGVIGAMMSSLIVGRAVLGKGSYGRLLNQAICH